MVTVQTRETRQKLTGLQWLICATGALGFAFAIYMYLMLPLIVGPATAELLGAKPGSPELNRWVGLMFWVPALCGGAFGLLGGYLIDRLGRLPVLVGSILLYGLSAFLGGFAPSMGWLLVARCGVFVGVSVEFVAAVTWLAELFPDHKQREAVIGYTQVAQSGGGILVAAVYGAAVTVAPHLPGALSGYQPWRYTMMTGLIPVIVVLALLPFLPESPVWRGEEPAGTPQPPRPAEPFKPPFPPNPIVTTHMMASPLGAPPAPLH